MVRQATLRFTGIAPCCRAICIHSLLDVTAKGSARGRALGNITDSGKD